MNTFFKNSFLPKNIFFSPLSQFETIFATNWWDHIFLIKENEDFTIYWISELSIVKVIFNSIIFTFIGAIILILFIVNTSMEGKHLFPKTGEEIIRFYLFSTIDNFIRSNNSLGFQVYYIFYFELIISIFYYNFVGLTPFGFTITSHLYVAFTIAFSVFFGLNFIGIYKRKWKFLGNFIPEGTLFELIGLIVFLELISYFSRLFSLSIRLFANIIAGHAILKIFASFVMSAIFSGSVAVLPAIIGINGLFAILIIEFAVAGLQLYVFITLVFIYINEGIKGNH
jgi:F-type H+-transporting ATPase subunit a